jgi:tripartite-type tricarboxylate transporter receptor subunit TctC
MEQGRIPAGTAGITSFITPYRGGRVKLLAISSAKRLGVAPAVPTIVEVGYPKLEQTGWYAFFAPPGMEMPLVEAWSEELRVVLESSEVVDQLRQLGFQVETSTPAEMASRLALDFAKWKADLDLLGIKTVN